jgi:predicted dehydrogenase
MIVKPELVGEPGELEIDLGLIGCGGRGTWIADLFKKHGGYNIVALADYFPDRVEAAGDKLGAAASSRFTGLSAYRRLLEQKLDAVAIESPPFFHPIQAADAVAAGKHVYLAKPAAVDVPGCMTIEQSAKKATASQRCFLIDFQTRATAPFMEAMRRVHSGALGSFVFGEATYHAEDPFLEKVDAVKAGTPEGVLRGWGLSREYSGDIITEQNIHTLDVMNWIMAKPPISASGTGGRKFRKVGTCWDTFSVTYRYADDVGIAFTSRQFDGFGTRPEGIGTACSAPRALETGYGGQYWSAARTSTTAARRKTSTSAARSPTSRPSMTDREGRLPNPTVAERPQQPRDHPRRTAAYEGRVITWDELMKSEARLTPDLKGLKDCNGP